MPSKLPSSDESYGLGAMAEWLDLAQRDERDIATDRHERLATVDFEAPRSEHARDPVPPPEAFGRYRVVRFIDGGGFASVYEAVDDHLQRRVAVKALYSPPKTGASGVHALLAEAQRLAQIDHANIVKVYDCGSTPEGRPYIVTELVDGTSLEKRLTAAPWPWPPTLRCRRELAAERSCARRSRAPGAASSTSGTPSRQTSRCRASAT